jgi:hypothetical protein
MATPKPPQAPKKKSPKVNNDGAGFTQDSHQAPPLSVYHATSPGRIAQSTDAMNQY